MTRRLVFTGEMTLERVLQTKMRSQDDINKFMSELENEMVQAKYYDQCVFVEIWRELPTKKGQGDPISVVKTAKSQDSLPLVTVSKAE